MLALGQGRGQKIVEALAVGIADEADGAGGIGRFRRRHAQAVAAQQADEFGELAVHQKRPALQVFIGNSV